MRSFSLTGSGKSLAALVLGAAAFAAVQSVSGQVIFSDNFQTGYTYNSSFTGQNGWTTNDPYRPNASFNGGEVGQSDGVGFVNGFSVNAADRSAFMGGIYAPSVYPGNAQVRNSHAVNLAGATAMSFNVDFSVTASGGSFPSHDNFGFVFRDGSGVNAASLFSINFVVPNNGANDFDNISYTSGNSTPAAQTSFQLGLRFHLTVTANLTNNTFSASYFRQLASGASAGEQVFNIATNVPFTGTIADVAASWDLANNSRDTASGAYTNPGSNILLFDNLVVAVPEPSTYAMLALGVFGLVAYARSRRAQQVV